MVLHSNPVTTPWSLLTSEKEGLLSQSRPGLTTTVRCLTTTESSAGAATTKANLDSAIRPTGSDRADGEMGDDLPYVDLGSVEGVPLTATAIAVSK